MKSAILLIAVVSCARAAEIPVTLVSSAEAEALHSAIVRREAWTLDSVRRLRADAEHRMKEGPWSVTNERPQGVAMDIHEYYSDAPYWWPQEGDSKAPYVRRDGQTNPNRFTANRNALVSLCDAVFSLGAAAYLLDDQRAAQRAVRDINTWFLNPKTRMTPNLENAQTVRNYSNSSNVRAAGIIEGRAFIRAVQGMEFLAQTGYWDAREQAAVRKWFQEYLTWLTTSNAGNFEGRSGNNHASWWTAQVAAIATFVENEQLQKTAFNYYRDHIFPRQIKADGSAPREEARNRGLWYSAFNLEAMTMICRIAQIKGVDLWSVHTKGNATIVEVLEYLEPYLADPRKWTKEQTTDFANDGLYFLAYAGIGLRKPEYIALYRKLEHPEGAWLGLTDLLVGRNEAAGHQTRH
ncbi:MAG: alginate lyase family protein [Candidatus Solibacter sp.]